MSKAHPPELKKFMDKKVHLRYECARLYYSVPICHCLCGHLGPINETIDLSRAGEPANFLAVPALAPDFFFNRLRLLILFPSGSGSGSCFFSSDSGCKEPKALGSDRLGSRLLVKFGKIFFSPQVR